MSRSGSKMCDQLIIVEHENAIVVAWADDPDDWVVDFDKHPGFPRFRGQNELFFSTTKVAVQVVWPYQIVMQTIRKHRVTSTPNRRI